MKRQLTRLVIPAIIVSLITTGSAFGANGVGPGGFSLEIIAFENCPDGDFTGSNRRMIAVEANYQVVDGEIKSNHHHALVKDLIRNNTISLMPAPPGEGFQVLDGNACGAGKADAILQLPITDANCDPCNTDGSSEFTEYTVSLALVGAPNSRIGVSTCGEEPIAVEAEKLSAGRESH